MPSIKVLENYSLKSEYLDKIKEVKLNIQETTYDFGNRIAETLQEEFWLKPNFEDKRLSEAAKQI